MLSQAPVDNTFDLAIVKFSRVEGLNQVLKNILHVLKENAIGLLVDSDSVLDSLEASTFLHGRSTFWRSNSVSLVRMGSLEKSPVARDVMIVPFAAQNTENLQADLLNQGFNIITVVDPLNIPPECIVLILDELQVPVVPKLDQRQWAILQILVERKCRILWVTRGAQISVTDPMGALITGLF